MATKTKIINPPMAVKATRGTASLWTKNGRFGSGTAPKANAKDWPAHLLQETAIDLLGQGYSLRIVQHD